MGWWRGKTAPRARREALAYMGRSRGVVNWCFIRLLFSSVADIAVVSIQDMSGPGTETQINKPATRHGNWKWRLHAQ